MRSEGGGREEGRVGEGRRGGLAHGEWGVHDSACSLAKPEGEGGGGGGGVIRHHKLEKLDSKQPPAMQCTHHRTRYEATQLGSQTQQHGNQTD